MRASISLLTDPIPTGRYALPEAARRTARVIRNVVKPPPVYLRSPYRGHFAMTRSYVEGLKTLGVPFTYNPNRLADLSDTVVVLSGLQALRQAIDLKREGRIRRLLAGPNLVEFPFDARELICAPEVDVCVTLGELTCKIYVEDCPELAGRCAGCPAGVDTHYWSPAPSPSDRRGIVFYDKPIKGPTDAIDRYIAHVTDRGYPVTRIDYGSYTSDAYRRALQQSRLLVGFSAEESQGVCWTEAWATDVPTFLWYKDRHSFNHPRSQGRTFETSPAPQQTAETGRFFTSLDDFTRLFAEWEAGRVACRPRAWVLEHLTDAAAARRLCEVAGVRTSS